MTKYVTSAQNIIMEAFSAKKDKAGSPYIFHLQRVAQPFINSEKLYIVALLHDLLEDCPEWNSDRLTEYFPVDIRAILFDLTRQKDEAYSDYIKRVSQCPEARLIKLSDLRDNMDVSRFTRPLTNKDFERIAKYHKAYLQLKAYTNAVEHDHHETYFII